MDVSVTKDGKPVLGLKAADFEIFEDGHPQTITNFAYVSNVEGSPAPLNAKLEARDSKNEKASSPPPTAPVKVNDAHRTIAIVVDDLGLSAESMTQVRRQLHKFVDEQLQPNDLVAIIRTGGDVGALQQFTNDKRLLRAAVDHAQWNPCSRVGLFVLPPVQSTMDSTRDLPGCGTHSILDTIRSLRFILKSMAELPGRKSMVLLSDSIPREEQDVTIQGGDDGDSSDSLGGNSRNYYVALQKLAELSIRSSVVIYGVDTQGLQYPGLTAADRLSASSRAGVSQMNSIYRSRSDLLLQRREGAEILSRETGGFSIHNSNDFKLDRILEDQQGYYLIGYRPAEETFNRRFHHIKARVKGSGLSLRTRFGFYGITEDEAKNAQRTPDDKTTLALISPFGAHDIAVDLTTFFANTKTAGSLLRSFVLLNAKDLTFADDGDGWHKATVEVRGIVFGNNGQIVDQLSHTTTLRIRGQSYERALRDGISLQFDTPIKRPGSYQLRVAARDLASSHIGAAGQFVSVPDLTNQRLALSGIILQTAGAGRNGPMRPPTSSAATTPAGDSWSAPNEETGGSPAVRRFSPGSNLLFACVIYNAVFETNGHPQLTLRARLFRDGKAVDTSSSLAVDVTNQIDLSRIMVGGIVRLKDDLQPGKYFLQVVVNDVLAKNKQSETIQWVDFEIVKP